MAPGIFCRGPAWVDSDFTSCVDILYLHIILPLIAIAVSTCLVIPLLRKSTGSINLGIDDSLIADHSSPYDPEDEEGGLYPLRTTDHSESTDGGSVLPVPVAEDSIEDSYLMREDEHKEDTDLVFLPPNAVRLRAALERAFVAAAIVLHLVSGVIATFNKASDVSVYRSACSVLFWSYILFLTFYRNTTLSSDLSYRVSANLACLFTIYWVISVIDFRSQLVSQHSKFFSIVTFFDTALATALFVIALCSPLGVTPAYVKVNKGLTYMPEPYASFASILTFSWLVPLLLEGRRAPLKMDTLWDLSEEMRSPYLSRRFRAVRRTASFRWTLFNLCVAPFIVNICIAVVSSMLTFGPTICLRLIVSYIENPGETPRHMAWLYVLVLFVTSLSSASLDSLCSWGFRKNGNTYRSILITEIYAKALRRKITSAVDNESPSKETDDDKTAAAKLNSSVVTDDDEDSEGFKSDDTDTGRIVNLMAIDATKIADTFTQAGILVKTIIIVFFAFYLLFKMLGISAIAGIIAFLALVPVNVWISKSLATNHKDSMEITDKRVSMTNEILQNIKIIKYFAWESMFKDKLMEIRNKEVNVLIKFCLLATTGGATWFGTPLIMTLALLGTYISVTGNPLTASLAFGTISLVNVIKTPLENVSFLLTMVMSAKVSLDRIENFINDDSTTEKYSQLSKPRGPNSPYIGFENASFTWGSSKSAKKFILSDFSIDFPVGKLTVIVGPTGAGKTSMLMALLGEMNLLKGSVYLPGVATSRKPARDPETGFSESVAYCAQQAWLINDSIRNNILFGRPMDEARYRRTVYACALVRDFEILEHGDLTEVGEKGISLSGGQKQRISLARAVYSDAKHLLLDDCLSAIDTHSALWVYNKCIKGPMMQGRTCILVSHNISLSVPDADFIVSVNNGRVKFQGTPVEASEENVFGDDDALRRNISSRNTPAPSTIDLKSLNVDPLQKTETLKADEEDTEEEAKKLMASIKMKDVSEAPQNAESQQTGSIKLSTYLTYFQYMGSKWFWLTFVVACVLQQLAEASKNLWVSHWSDTMASVESEIEVTKIGGEHSSFFYFSIYALISFIFLLITYLREALLFYGSIMVSRKLFDDITNSIMYASPRFFDITPVGRILNRFGKDITTVDREIVTELRYVALHAAELVTVLIIISAVVPQFLIVAFVIGCAVYFISNLYSKSSLELRRLQSTTQSPIYQHFGETLNGLATIRAYGQESRFAYQNMSILDYNMRPYTIVWVCNRWMTFCSQSIGTLVAVTTAFLLIWLSDRIDPGFAGLILTYAISFAESMVWFVFVWTLNEMNMNSVERVIEYIDIEQEPPAVIECARPPAGWPHAGSIQVENLSLRYAPELPKVISGLTFEAKPGWNIGVVGRTGAGKSTIASAFFRFLEAQEGRIVIDGIDISTIGLRDLREALAIIPQDPTLFSGTIRSNLDPFNQYSDAAIFETLRRVHLIDSETDISGASSSTQSEEAQFNVFTDLSSPVAESGNNLSQGQRQLMCLARSLLKSPQIIFLDEATASIDYATDALLQQTIREEFRKSTIMTIAHRLRSIIDYDRILVLDAGRLVEFASPFELITKENGIFRGMCESSGEFDVLTELAEKACKEKELQEQQQ